MYCGQQDEFLSSFKKIKIHEISFEFRISLFCDRIKYRVDIWYRWKRTLRTYQQFNSTSIKLKKKNSIKYNIFILW